MATLHQLAIGLNTSEKTLHSWNKNFKINPIPNEEGQLCYTEEQKELLLKVHRLVKKRGFTIAGAKMELEKEPFQSQKEATIKKLTEVRSFLEFLKEGI